MNNYKLWESYTEQSLNKARDVTDFLHNEFLPDGADSLWSDEYFYWKLGDVNPAGKGYLAYAIHEGRVVASASLTKKRILLDGIECIAGEVGDTYTSKEFRRKSMPINISKIDSNPKSYVNKSIFGRLISDLVEKSKKEGISIIYGTPNQNSYPGYTKRLEFVDFKYYNNKTYLRPTVRLLLSKFPFLKPVGIFFRFFEISTINLQYFIYSRIVNSNVEIKFSPPSLIDLDKLWLNNIPNEGFSLIRDYSYWKYRFIDHPISNYQFFSFYQNKELVAIAVARKYSSRENNHSVAIVEWMHNRNFKFGHILCAVLDFYKKAEVNYFYTWLQAGGENSKIAQMNLFLVNKSAPIIFADNTSSKDLKDNKKNLSFFLGSSDAI